MKKDQNIYLVIRSGVTGDATRSDLFWATGPADAKRQFNAIWTPIRDQKLRATKFRPDGQADFPTRKTPSTVRYDG